MYELSEEDLQEVYAWIDEIPLSRQKKNIARDFSDGVLAAEVVHHFLPKLVDLHNYTPANSTQQKTENWRTLNRKVLSRLNFPISDDLIQGAAIGTHGVIESFLRKLRSIIENYLHDLAAKTRFKNGDRFGTPSQEHYHPEQIVATHPTRLPWIEDENRSYSLDNHQGFLGLMDRTYPKRPNNSLPLLPSRIPLPSNKKDYNHDIQSLPSTSFDGLPPIPVGGQSKKKSAIPTKQKHINNYKHRSGALTKRADSATIDIKMAEKDQKLLESQECIQFLQMKLTRYEHLVQIKDMKIMELKKELEAVKKSGRQPFQDKHSYLRR